MLLAGDVGGTKIALALCAVEGGRVRRLRERVYVSSDHPGLAPILEDFLRGPDPGPGRQPVTAACLGVAGPVLGNRATIPNLDWVVDAAQIRRATGIQGVELVNDLVAMGEGIAALGPDQLATLQAGSPARDGNAALLAAGTGLGVAVLAAQGTALVPLASEGGHADYAARDEEDVALLAFLRARFGRVSVERVVSGLGLANLYDFQLARHPDEADAEVRREVAAAPRDAARAIAEAATAGRCRVCARALEMFVAAWGAAAGNLALTALSTRGLYLGGGMAPKLLPRLRDGRFLAAFHDKGRFRGLMERIPVHVILEQRTPLLGAALRAARLADGNPGGG